MYPTCVQQNSQLKSTMTVAILIYRRKTLRQPPDDLQARVRVKIRFRHLYFPTAICSENPPPLDARVRARVRVKIRKIHRGCLKNLRVSKHSILSRLELILSKGCFYCHHYCFYFPFTFENWFLAWGIPRFSVPNHWFCSSTGSMFRHVFLPTSVWLSEMFALWENSENICHCCTW